VTQEAQIEGSLFRLAREYAQNPIQRVPKAKGTGGMAQVTEHLSSQEKALSSSTVQLEKKTGRFH
jgi:hypothetical protein